MPNSLEKLIKLVYRKWQLSQYLQQDMHPDEEAFACLKEGRLPKEEAEEIKKHLLSCSSCSRDFAFSLGLKVSEEQKLPLKLLESVKNLINAEEKPSLLEIILRVKERALEVLSTSGDVLVGQEFIPAPILRSRSIKDFKDEVTILKDFKDLRVEAKIENKGSSAFSLVVKVKDKATQNIIKDLRVSLFKDDVELESYLSDSGLVIFEHVLLGRYTIEISCPENKLASILVEIKI